MHAQADGQISFTDRQGRYLPEAVDARFRRNVSSLMSANDQAGVSITPETGACHWGGEKMDDELAVLCMQQQGYTTRMNFNPTDRFKISDEVLSQQVNGEAVLLDLEGKSCFGLNEVGTRICENG